jgi:predicted hydrolase (HD superfamily)
MITREQAIELLHQKMQSVNLRRHCYAVEAVMGALAKHFGESEDRWRIVGLLHDGDYEETKAMPEQHTLKMVDWLKEIGKSDSEIISAILSHNFSHTGQNSPQNKLEWSLYCCDELTGLIVAVTLVRPEKKLALVTAENILGKWKEKSFAAGVKREQIEQCETKLGIPLTEFIQIALAAMQNISADIGL